MGFCEVIDADRGLVCLVLLLQVMLWLVILLNVYPGDLAAIKVFTAASAAFLLLLLILFPSEIIVALIFCDDLAAAVGIVIAVAGIMVVLFLIFLPLFHYYVMDGAIDPSVDASDDAAAIASPLVLDYQ